MSSSYKTVLLVGGGGQIGRFLIPLLIEQGFTIHATSRKNRVSDHPNVIWHQCDISDSVLPDTGAGIIIWIAYLPFLLDQIPYTKDIKRIIGFSSTSRFAKTTSKNPSEQRVANDLASSEHQLDILCEQFDIDWTVFRPTLIYGCNIDQNIATITSFIRRFRFFPLTGEGSGLRQPVHAQDLAMACVKAIHNPQTFNKSYNLSGGETLSYKEMVERVFRVLGKKTFFVKIPLSMYRMALGIIRLWPRYWHLSVEMANRINKDLCFPHTEAANDFGYSPRSFQPPAIR